MTDPAALDRSFARLVRLVEARALPEVEQSTSYDTPALEVGGTTFVRVSEPDIAVLQCPVDQKVLLMEISPDIFFETDHYIGHDAILVRLDRISDEELTLKLEDAWTFKAPQRLKSAKQ